MTTAAVRAGSATLSAAVAGPGRLAGEGCADRARRPALRLEQAGQFP
jgi:hypothetical protein